MEVYIKENIIDLRNVSLSRNGQRILSGISLAIHRGEHWAILGPNGSGKTTLLNIISGYLWPMEGTVTVLGDRYGTVDIREKRRHIGLVSSALFERIPSRETLLNVVLSGRFASLGIYEEVRSHDREKAMEIISFLKCENIAHRRYGVLSFGERQRALIGRALMADPALLILDEPCEGLDIQSREIILSSLESIISSHGITLLMVSHWVEEILPAITHALILKNGEILDSGEKNTTITSVNMSRAMDITIEILHRNNRLYTIIG